MNLRRGGVISSLDSCSRGQQHHFWSDFANLEKGRCFEEKAQSSSFRRPSLSKVSFCVSLPTTEDLETSPQLCLHLGPRAREPKLREGGPGAGWGKHGRSLGPALAEILARTCEEAWQILKAPVWIWGASSQRPWEPAPTFPPSPKKWALRKRPSPPILPLAPSLTAERVQGMRPRSTHSLLSPRETWSALGTTSTPRCSAAGLTTTAPRG